jgi:hypothetical protein
MTFLTVSVTTYGDGHILASVLSGVKSVLGSGEFHTTVVITFLLGTLLVAYGTLLGTFQIHATLKNIFSHYFILIALFYALLVPKENVLIYDAVSSDPGSTVIVENVPYGVSMLLYFSNTIEQGLTRVFDNAFNTPFAYSQYGYNYYNMLLNELTNIKSDNPYFNASLSNFIKDCFFYDVISGDKSVNSVVKSNNVWNAMRPASSVGVITTIRCDPTSSPNECLNNGGSKATATVGCQTAYSYISNLLNDSATAALNDIDKKILNGAANLPLVAQQILNVSATSDELVRQAIVSNYLPDAYKNAIAMMSNADVTQYSTAMAEVQAKQQMSTSGEMAKRYLPVIRWILNGMVYGGFPLLFIVALTPIGLKAIQGYMGLGLAQISWGPLFAILNNIVYTKTTDEFATVLGHFSPDRLTTIHNATENLIALSGQVAWLIPIATLSIAGVGFLGAGSLLSSLGSVAQSSALSAGQQASGISGIKQAEIAGYMQGASVTGHSMGELLYTSGAWGAFSTAGIANPDSMPGVTDITGPSLGLTSSHIQTAALNLLQASGNPTAPTVGTTSAAIAKYNQKASQLGLSPERAGQFEQNPVLTRDMLDRIPNLSENAKKALEGAYLPGGLENISLNSEGKLISPITAFKQEGGLTKGIHVSPDGQVYTVISGTENGIAYSNVMTNSEGQITSGTILGNFNIGDKKYSGALTVNGSSAFFTGIDPQTGQQVSWSGNMGSMLNMSDVQTSSGVINSPGLNKLYEAGSYTGPMNVAGIKLDNAVVQREGGVSRITGFLSPEQVKSLSNTLKNPKSPEARNIIGKLGLSGAAIQAIHNAAKKGQGLVMTTTQNPDGKYANTEFRGGASAVLNNSGTVAQFYDKNSVWSSKSGSIEQNLGHQHDAILTAQDLSDMYKNVVSTMGENSPIAKSIKAAMDYANANNTMVAAQWRLDPNTGQVTSFTWQQHAEGQVGDALRKDIDHKQVNIGPFYNLSLKGLIFDVARVDKYPKLGWVLTGIGAGFKAGMTALLLSKYPGGSGAAGTATAGGIASGSGGAGTGAGTSSSLSNAGKYFQGIGRSFSNIPLIMIIPIPVLQHELNSLGSGGKPQS